MTPPVSDLLSALERAGLSAHALELREYLDAGVPIDEPLIERLLREGAPDARSRPYQPREEVEAACRYLEDYLIGPYRQIEEAEIIAGRLGQRKQGVVAPSKRRRIMLIDERFEDAEPLPAVTEAEWAAIEEVAKALPAARRAMLRAIGEDGDGDVQITPTNPIDGDGDGDSDGDGDAPDFPAETDESELDKIEARRDKRTKRDLEEKSIARLKLEFGDEEVTDGN